MHFFLDKKRPIPGTYNLVQKSLLCVRKSFEETFSSPLIHFVILQNISMKSNNFLDQNVNGKIILQKVANHIVIILTFFRAYPKL